MLMFDMSKKIIQQRICTIEGCVREHAGLGFCACHLYRFRRGLPMEAPIKIYNSEITHEGARRKLLSMRKINTNGCWIFTNSKNDQGYGRVYIGNKQIRAHRLSMFAWRDFDLDSSLLILHDCPEGDNPSCFNPDHLQIGDYGDNLRDAYKKGQIKAMRGSLNGMAKLSEKDIPKIRKLLKKGMMLKEIGEKFGVSDAKISEIKHKRSWKHVP